MPFPATQRSGAEVEQFLGAVRVAGEPVARGQGDPVEVKAGLGLLSLRFFPRRRSLGLTARQVGLLGRLLLSASATLCGPGLSVRVLARRGRLAPFPDYAGEPRREDEDECSN